MIYTLKFIYQDGKELNINIEKEDLKPFFESLSKKEMYFDENQMMGFWSDLDKVRWIQANRQDMIQIEEFQHEPQLQTSGGFESLPVEDAANTIR